MKFSDIQNDARMIDLKKLQEQDFSITPNIKKSIEIYNSAISNIQVGNVDIAIIKLKKVVSLRPDFSEASNLLEVLLNYEKKKGMDEIKENMQPEKNKKRESVLHPIINIKQKTLPERLHISPRSLMKIIILFIFIVVITAVILIVASVMKNGDKPADPTVKTENIDQLRTTINQLVMDVDDLNSELDNKNQLINDNTTSLVVLEDDNDTLDQLLNLYIAKSYFADEKYTKAAEILMGLNVEVYTDEHLDIYNQIYTITMTESAKSVYNVGINLFSQQNYEGSLENLLLVKMYDNNFEEMGQTLFYLGKTYYELDAADKAIEIYKELDLNYPKFPDKDYILYNAGKAYMKLENTTKALEMFNLIINDYPESSVIGAAKDKINELKN